MKTARSILPSLFPILDIKQGRENRDDKILNHSIMSNNEWRDIKGFEGRYQISNTGLIKSLGRFYKGKFFPSEKVLAPNIEKNGYARARLFLNGKYSKFGLHRIVATAFIPNPDNKKEVNHIDSNPKNNSVENLEWATRSENMKHLFLSGRSKIHLIYGAAASHRSLKVNQLSEDGLVKIAAFASVNAAARLINRSHNGLTKAIKGRRVFSGFRWEYVKIAQHENIEETRTGINP